MYGKTSQDDLTGANLSQGVVPSQWLPAGMFKCTSDGEEVGASGNEEKSTKIYKMKVIHPKRTEKLACSISSSTKEVRKEWTPD